MKNIEAMKIIDEYETRANEPTGYMVAFERREHGMLCSDHFPDKHAGEQLIETEEEAWELAKRFDDATGSDCVNIDVRDQSSMPVDGYKTKKLSVYPPHVDTFK